MLRRVILALAFCLAWAAGARAACNGLAFNGTTAFAQTSAAMTTGSPAAFSVAYWLKVTAFADDDHLSMESSTNSNNNAGAFVHDPDSTLVSGRFHVSGKSITSASSDFARPSATDWHHYVVTSVMSDWGTTPWIVYVDGVSQTMHVTATAAGGAFSDYVLYLMSRAGASLFLAGSMSNVAIWTSALTPTDAANLYAGSAPTGIGGGALYWWKLDGTSNQANYGSGSAITMNSTNATLDATAPAAACAGGGGGGGASDHDLFMRGFGAN